jgi:hypothetical protein
MVGTLKTAVLAAFVTAAASTAGAAPSNLGQLGDTKTNGIVLVHGYHRSCERGPGGWHRHNRFGERRPCREWRGQGRRPDYCVRVGPVWYCDY